MAAIAVLPQRRARYVGVQVKFGLALLAGVAWLVLAAVLAAPWARDLARETHWLLAAFVIGGIAIVPGSMNAFLVSSLLMDRRPPRAPLAQYPGITILIAAYNEESSIEETVRSIDRQGYPGAFEVVIVDDGSTDRTGEIIDTLSFPWLRALHLPRNAGKAIALNRGLALARFPLVATLDADSSLHGDALRHAVERYVTDPPNTRAVAGTVLVRNSRRNWLTRTQEWDYFHGIQAVKRVQSLYQGTLVAQGAFSLYDAALLRGLGGWEDTVGEDIVLTWAILDAGWRVGHAEDAICFTHVPETLSALLRQRQRWARGMLEAMRRHPTILARRRLSTTFIWWNLLFPWLDSAFTFAFLPGLVLALFGVYWLAGPYTLLLLPLSLLMNAVMYRVATRTFDAQGLRVRYNPAGFLLYAIGYSILLQPASVAGYLAEVFGTRKTWGTK